MNKRLLSSFLEVVVFLFAGFGGFLKNIAPPEQSGVTYIAGISSFLALIVLMIVSALARSAPGQRYRRRWVVAGVLAFVVALPATYLYPQALRQYTWWYPDSTPRLRGSDADVTPEVKVFLTSHPDAKDPKALARNFEPSQIWTDDSLKQAGSRLSLLYTWLILSLATTVFCLLEANASKDKSSAPAAPVPVGDGGVGSNG